MKMQKSRKKKVNLSVSSSELLKCSARGAIAALSSFSEMPNVGRLVYRSSTGCVWLTGSANDDDALTSCESDLCGCTASKAVELCVRTFRIGASS